MIVTIDGPAGSGKSTVARLVAQRLGLPHVDTGAMYRELAAVALERGVDPDDEAALAALVGVAPAPGTDLRGERISAVVSGVSRHPRVRERMRARQRAVADGSAVLEGRDTGTQVCPDAELKVYLTASPAVRAARRAHDLGLPAADVERTIAERDRRDARQLPPAADAHRLDTSNMTVDEVVEAVLALAREAA